MSSPTFPLQLADPGLLHSRAYIDGAWVDATDGAEFTVENPATGDVIARVANLDGAQTDAAIAAAQRAMPAWSRRTGKDRARLLRNWFELMLEHTEDLARLMTLEQGKPLAEARGEVAYAASFIEWFAEEAKRVAGEIPASPMADARMLVLRQPIGVCAAITPWNFPLAMITRKAGPALAAGCSMVIKPAEQTPLSALALAELADRAGIPAGVLNLVTADGGRSIEVGKALCASPAVRKLSFTGSTEVGRILMRQSSDTIKKLSLELGGNAPFIVFDDADLDAAVEGAIASKYRNSGQTCVCSNRFYAHDKVYDAFVEKLAERSRQLPVGDGFGDGVLQGPLIDDDAVAKVESQVRDAVERGARVVAGGKIDARGPRFYQPTVLADVTPDMRCMQDETFGPVAPVARFHTDDEVIALANSLDVGLASYFYSRDMARIFRVAEALEFGMVGVNTGLISNEVAPFGGVKQSGLGREGSIHGIDDYLELKYVCLGGIGR
ncbi:MAG: NAD-dependent succinate-semialdehyde dehydrogenase [Pigmentiphaga sp.]|nr:NAD-dependent succinate-semialdehyde dehydrogenase [Pigmentiphaga sp.]